jgi:hypothetical protein
MVRHSFSSGSNGTFSMFNTVICSGAHLSAVRSKRLSYHIQDVVEVWRAVYKADQLDDALDL